MYTKQYLMQILDHPEGSQREDTLYYSLNSNGTAFLSQSNCFQDYVYLVYHSVTPKLITFNPGAG